MRRILPLLVLIGFLVYNGVFIFVYLFRAFRIGEPDVVEAVYIWHGDPFIRTLLVALFFLMGLVVLMYVTLTWTYAFRGGQVRFRSDLWEWLVRYGRETNEPPEVLAQRAVASYRSRLEGIGEL